MSTELIFRDFAARVSPAWGRPLQSLLQASGPVGGPTVSNIGSHHAVRWGQDIEIRNGIGLEPFILVRCPLSSNDQRLLSAEKDI